MYEKGGRAYANIRFISRFYHHPQTLKWPFELRSLFRTTFFRIQTYVNSATRDINITIAELFPFSPNTIHNYNMLYCVLVVMLLVRASYIYPIRWFIASSSVLESCHAFVMNTSNLQSYIHTKHHGGNFILHIIMLKLNPYI